MAIEKLDIYDLTGRYLHTQERPSYYESIKKERAETGQITTQVKTVRVRAMRSDGSHILQRRSFDKKENPGLYDKFVGGHVSSNSISELTLLIETMQEF